ACPHQTESQDDYRQSNPRRNAAHDRRHATGSLAPLRVPRRAHDHSGRARRRRAGLRHTDGRYLCRLAVSDQRRARAHRHVFGPQCSGFLWTLVTALLSVVVGGVLLWKPAEGAVSLTIVLVAFFIVEG